VGSYPTFSPLPTEVGGLFLWPFPSPFDAQVLPGSLPFGARTFLGSLEGEPRPPHSTTTVKIVRGHSRVKLTPVHKVL